MLPSAVMKQELRIKFFEFVVATVTVALFFESAFCNHSGSPNPNWICTEPAKPVSTSGYRQQYYTRSYSCGWWGWSRCRRTLSRRELVTLYVLKPAISMCCPGYVNSTEGICIPYCENCSSPKTCVEPHMCVCPPGWSGDSCSLDVNECLTDNGGCNQTCTNTQGSYVCSCIGQYTLDDDQHGCIEPVPIAVTFVSNDMETFSIKWSVPTRNHSSVPQGVTLSCSNTYQNIILNTNITHTDTMLRLDMNRTVMCCVSAPNAKTKCVTYNPNVNDPGTRTTTKSDNVVQENDKLALIVGVAGALLLLLLLLIAVIIIILICKAIKSKNKQAQLINDSSSDYEREYQVHIYEAVHSPEVQAANHLSSPYTEIPRGRRVQYASIRFDKKKQVTPAARNPVSKHKPAAVNILQNEYENGYLRLV